MKPLLIRVKFFIGIFFQLLLVTAVFVVGYGMSFTSIDLNKVNTLSGKIITVIREQLKGSKAMPGQRTLVIDIAGQEYGFWVYRSSQNYSDLLSALPVGDTAKLYYKATPNLNGYETYQVETSKGVIYSKDEYERKEKLAGRFIALPGACIMLGVVIFSIRKRYKRKLA